MSKMRPLSYLFALILVVAEPGASAPPVGASENDLLEEGHVLLEEFYSRYNATKQVDLVFVLDRSGSVPLAGWLSMLEFVGKILEHFTVDEENTRVAVITFSTTASVDINDLVTGDGGADWRRRSQTKCTLYARLRERVESKIPFGYTATNEALRKAFRVLVDSRPNAKKAVLILTDGKSNIGPPPVKSSFDILSLRWNRTWNSESLGPQVELYAFGIENAYVPELRSIASNLPNHVFMIPKFSLFADFARSLHGGLQKENWLATEHNYCTPTCNSTFARCMCGSRAGIYACACNPGYEMTGDVCTACPIGYYKESLKPEKCSRCPENTTTDNTAAVSVKECHPLAGYQVCGPLPDIAHGRKFQVTGTRKDEVLNTGIPCNDVRDGNSCHYECDVGYRLSGPPVMICNNSGFWDGEIPNCNAIDCYDVGSTFGDIRGAEVTYRDNNTLYGARAEVTCHPGRVPLPAVTKWSCDQHGQWTIPSGFQCAEVFCPPVQLSPFMTVSPLGCATDLQPHASVCQLSCVEGFELVGAASVACSFTNRAVWTTERWPTCKDIQKPVIYCPDNITLTLPRFKQNSTRIHPSVYDNPVISDNSWPPGVVNYTIEDLPPDGVFHVGVTFLRYVAVDSEGNVAKCTQSIHVIEKKVEIRKCPSDIQKVGRSMAVTWDDPEFIGMDGELLSHTCTPPSGSVFSGEGNRVACYHEDFPEAKCLFDITVKPKDCPRPDDPPPSRGALTCGRNSYLQQICRIMCQKGYSMKDLSKQEFRCRDDGTWTPELGNWPMCSKTGWGRNVLIVQSMHIRYSGNCLDNTETIKEAFEATMRHILTREFGPCSEDHLCSVQDIKVMCGPPSRRKRHIHGKSWPHNRSGNDNNNNDNDNDNDNNNNNETKRRKRSVEGIEIEFALWVEYNETRDMSRDEQRRLLTTLEVATFAISDMVEAGNFSLELNGERHLAETVELVNDIPDFRLNCSEGEVPVILSDNVDEMSARCIVCGPGSYLTNGDCLLCPNNTYQDEEGQHQCIPCPDGKVTLATGSWNVSQCKEACTPGSYSSTGYETCTLCGVGEYQTESGQTSCTRCPQNTTTDTTGIADVNLCKAPCANGTYSKTGLEPCTVCPPGTYQPSAGQRSCLACDYLNPTAEMDEWCLEPMNCSASNTSCLNGFCVMSQKNSVICKCNDGYHGDACELNINDCTADSCQNGGSCHDVTNGFICECPPAYSGANCQHYIGACSTSPCHNNASCVDNGTTFMCICAEGYNGTTCDEAIDPCASSPCIHGVCSVENDELTCTCDPGYGGTNCQKSIDHCANVTCHNGGTCTSTEESFHCRCRRGTTGEFCDKFVDYCTPEPCHGNGRCVNTMTSYYCICEEGYYGSRCTLNADPDFSLSFSDKKVGFVELPVWEALYNISVCLWMRSSDISHYGTLISYAAPSNWVSTTFSDAFTLYDYNNLQVIINGQAVDTHMKFNDGYWHHVCVVWSSNTGYMRIYVNGTISGSALVAKATHLEAPGRLVIGQRQLGELEQYFVSKNAYVGDISQLNVYSRVLEENVIMSLANQSSCTPGHGSVLAWTSVLQGVQGDLKVSAQCLDVNECLTPGICQHYEYCVDKAEGYECHLCPSAGCPGTPPQYEPCQSSPCLNHGSCISHLDTFRCVCPPGYTGLTCELLVSTCLNLTCYNGGTCHEVSGGVYCKCKTPWTGRYCQVLYEPRCADKPCLNGGTCHENNSTGHYTCSCPNDGREYGLNCEIITPCDRTPSPCISGATCLVIERDANFTCLCPAEFEGESCFYSPPLTSPTTPLDYCRNVQCQHGGLCTNLDDGFRCNCPIEYTGLYCDTEREKETRRYDVSVSLDVDYSPSLKQDEVFKQNIKQQVHNIYASSLKDSTLRVEIADIRPGSVEVDMIFYHTVYANTEAPEPKDMEVILYNNLKHNRFGSIPATTNNFKFNYKGELPTWIIYLVVCVVIMTLAVILIVPWYVITKRRRKSEPIKLNNMPMCDLHRVVNPAFEADSNPTTPQLRHLHEDNIYADLDPSPYAVDLCSGGKESDPELNKRFPSKRGRDINKDWASWQRQAMPLPPKPGESTANGGTRPCHNREDDGYLMPSKGTPPPSYKDVHDDEALRRYGRRNLNIDAEYVAPTSADDERADVDDLYLKPTDAKDNNNVNKARQLHVYINEPTKGQEREDQTQPTYLPLLTTPPGDATADRPPENDGKGDVTREQSPDYLSLNMEVPTSGSAPPLPRMKDIPKEEKRTSSTAADAAPEVHPNEREDRKCDSGTEKSEEELAGGIKKHVTVYAIGGANGDVED